jgi:low affinity Fe/Cu permease
MGDIFHKISSRVSSLMGSPFAFMAAILIIVIWAVSGEQFNYSDTWQLVINTGTTIVTFLMVFLIQNTQNRDARAIHLKLDELIKGTRGSRNLLVNVEELSDAQLEELHLEYRALHDRYHKALEKRNGSGTGVV